MLTAAKNSLMGGQRHCGWGVKGEMTPQSCVALVAYK